MTKKPYLSDVNDEKLDFVAPYLVLIGEQAKSDTAQNGVEPQMVKLPEAKKGFCATAQTLARRAQLCLAS